MLRDAGAGSGARPRAVNGEALSTPIDRAHGGGRVSPGRCRHWQGGGLSTSLRYTFSLFSDPIHGTST
jgi:hypothetical protein